MRNYEAIYILKPEMDEEAIAATTARFDALVTSQGGEVIKTENMGKRRLAYEIKDQIEGHYIKTNFKSAPAAAQELERVLRLQDDVIRQLVIKLDE